VPNRQDVYSSLIGMVGEEFVSNRPEELYLYSCDSSANPPRRVDYVVMPKEVEEVQAIVRLANDKKIPIVPMGAGLNLEALTLPVHGGIVMDMKRMDRILEVNEVDRYALIEAGVSQGALISYLADNHPGLQHSVPDAPPSATIAGSALICGYGHLSTNYGTHSEMINGLEVVLASGDVCKVGSSFISPYWFGRGTLPDLTGLFIGWFGTTGIITKLAIRLYPKPKVRDMVIYMMKDPSLLPDAIYKITHTQMAEDVSIIGQERPEWMKGYQIISVYISGSLDAELTLKRQILKSLFKNTHVEDKITFIEGPAPELKDEFLELPFFATKVADWKKGGGFEYAGAIMGLDKVARAWEQGMGIAHRHDMLYSYAIRIVDGGHHVLFTYSYPFNRADKDSMQKALDALSETQALALDIGAIPWKPELAGQKQVIEKMDPTTFNLLTEIKKTLDPNGIMNPGNWEASQDDS